MENYRFQLLALTTVLQTKEDCWISKRCCRDQTEDVHPVHWIMATGMVCMMVSTSHTLSSFIFVLINDRGQVWSRNYILDFVCVSSGYEHPAPSSQHPRQPEAPFHPGGWHLVLRRRPIHRREWVLSPSIPFFCSCCSYLPVPLSSPPPEYQACHLPGYSPHQHLTVHVNTMAIEITRANIVMHIN